MKSTLLELEAAFREADFEAQVTTVGDPVPVDQLLVLLGGDDEGRDYYLQLLFLRDLQGVLPVAEPLTEADGDLDYLQLYTALPVEIAPSAFPELARLILMINKTLRVGAFGLHEEDNRGVYLRHMMICPGGRVHAPAVLRTVEILLDYLDRYGDILEKVGTGQATMAEVLAVRGDN